MRLAFLSILLISFITIHAQMQLSPGVMGYSQRSSFNNYHLLSDSNSLKQKWSVSKYMGVSTSFGFYNGGNSSVLSVPIGLQINRRLSNNLFAFAGVTVAPSYFNANRSINDPGIYKMNPGFTQFSAKGFGMYSRVEGGLMYVNDERTFSISGSIGVERSSYPFYPSNRTNTLTQQPVSGARQ